MAYVQDPNTGEWTDDSGKGGGGGFSPNWGGALKGGAAGASMGAQFGGPWGGVIGGGLGALGGLFDIFGGGPSKSEELDVKRKELDIKQLVQMLAEMERTSKGKTNVASKLNSAPGLETSLAYAPLQRKSGGEKSAGPSRYDYQTIDQFLSGIPATGVPGKLGQYQFATSNVPSPDEEEARRLAAQGI